MEFSDPKGIYLQIADRVRDRILGGEWNAGERIPSVREMAVELGVNPNTVARSYQALVERSIIVNQRGRGYFVGPDAADRILEEMRQAFLLEELPRMVRTMRLLGIGPEEIAARFTSADED
ncbi:MAG: GntR family transcriptional regulator [Gammaproteobacteria bacterium]|nr:GntR family transcriptional regulator [Gammaproteobacteria bacterium]MDE0281473.1 GntR family transcriptional regulator [Gammaproteobacteria bacterium]MDE0715312.1 GntR family transcriptional regulator [Gammaproteobacteria bacterium]MYH91359.1 GntR family transcriptional regulator [Gammaproteobacteria bacterium]